MNVQCKACFGTGRCTVEIDKSKPCRICGGSGRVPDFAPAPSSKPSNTRKKSAPSKPHYSSGKSPTFNTGFAVLGFFLSLALLHLNTDIPNLAKLILSIISGTACGIYTRKIILAGLWGLLLIFLYYFLGSR